MVAWVVAKSLKWLWVQTWPILDLKQGHGQADGQAAASASQRSSRKDIDDMKSAAAWPHVLHVMLCRPPEFLFTDPRPLFFARRAFILWVLAFFGKDQRDPAGEVSALIKLQEILPWCGIFVLLPSAVDLVIEAGHLVVMGRKKPTSAWEWRKVVRIWPFELLGCPFSSVSRCPTTAWHL